MRTHAQIIEDAGIARIHELGLAASVITVKSWLRRGHIPAASFIGFVQAGLATFDELAAGAKPRKAKVAEVA